MDYYYPYLGLLFIVSMIGAFLSYVYRKGFNTDIRKAWRMMSIRTTLTPADIDAMLRRCCEQRLYCSVDRLDGLLCFRDTPSWMYGYGNTYYLKPQDREGHYTLYVSGSFLKFNIDIRRMRNVMFLLGDMPVEL